jgi:phosphoserine/homoserine phosphotransferase
MWWTSRATPEIWINVAEITGIPELRLTTRDISDYNVLMNKRLGILEANNLKLKDIQDVIARMEPLEGAVELIDWIRSRTQLIVVSDTFVQFAGPLMKKLGWPTLFCNTLKVAANGSVAGYTLRQEDGKRKSVEALQTLNYRVLAFGDSYNDITMLKAADSGILFRPPETIRTEFPEFPACEDYETLKGLIEAFLEEKMIENG